MPSVILAIETSTVRGQVALWSDEKVVFEETFSSHRSHNSQMFQPLGEALEMAGTSLELIVAGTGPGSYTGVRIGIAAAQGVSWSRKVPLVGLVSVLAPEMEGELPETFVVCGDARRGKFYTAMVSGGQLQGEISCHSLEVIQQMNAELADVPWLSYDDKPPANLAGVTLTKPSAGKLAELGSKLSKGEIESLASGVVEPHYLAAPFVTTKGF